jgi:uncharacterized protein (DUF488 family)
LTVYTIGHSTRTIGEFVALLRQVAVDTVIDVRALGGRRHRSPEAAPSPNTLWRNEAFRNYADYAATEAFRVGMDELRALIRDHCCAVMCAEAVWWRCHRRIIADYLLADGIPVAHILGPHQVAPATLTPGARRLRGRTLVYPGGEANLVEDDRVCALSESPAARAPSRSAAAPRGGRMN